MHQAFWTIFDGSGKEILSLPYSMREGAEEMLVKMRAAAKPRQVYYLNVSKKPLDMLPGTIAFIMQDERTIKGVSQKKTGDNIFWIKKFMDFEVWTVNVDKITFREVFTAHVHRSETRIITTSLEGVKRSMNMEEFETFAKARWPHNWSTLTIRLY